MLVGENGLRFKKRFKKRDEDMMVGGGGRNGRFVGWVRGSMPSIMSVSRDRPFRPAPYTCVGEMRSNPRLSTINGLDRPRK